MVLWFRSCNQLASWLNSVSPGNGLGVYAPLFWLDQCHCADMIASGTLELYHTAGITNVAHAKLIRRAARVMILMDEFGDWCKHLRNPEEMYNEVYFDNTRPTDYWTPADVVTKVHNVVISPEAVAYSSAPPLRRPLYEGGIRLAEPSQPADDISSVGQPSLALPQTDQPSTTVAPGVPESCGILALAHTPRVIRTGTASATQSAPSSPTVSVRVVGFQSSSLAPFRPACLTPRSAHDCVPPPRHRAAQGSLKSLVTAAQGVVSSASHTLASLLHPWRIFRNKLGYVKLHDE